MRDLNSLLRPSVARMGIRRQVEAAGVVDFFNNKKNDILGVTLASRTKAAYFRHGTLTLNTASSIVASELSLKKRELLSFLREHFGDEVKEIRSVISSLD